MIPLVALSVAVAVAAEPSASPVSLAEALALAERGAVGVQLASLGQDMAVLRVDQVRASRLPTASLNATISMWNDSQKIAFLPPGSMDCSALADQAMVPLCMGLSSEITVRDFVTASATARVVEPLTGQIAIGHQLDAAGAGVEAASAWADAARGDARYQAADAWYLAVATDRQLEIADAQVKSLEARVAVAQAAYAAKGATKNDVLLGQLALAQAKQVVLQGTALRDAAQARLGLAIGNGGLPVVPDGRSEQAPRTVTDIDALIVVALAHRADLRAQRAQIDAADAMTLVTASARLPQVNAVGVYMHSEGQGLFAERDAAFVGVTADWPVWSWGQKTDALDIARAGVQAQRAQLEAAEAGVRVEVRSRADALNAAAGAYDVATTSIAVAEESLHIADAKQKLGGGAMTEVLDAETALVRARSTQATALYDARRAEAALERAVGVDPFAR